MEAKEKEATKPKSRIKKSIYLLVVLIYVVEGLGYYYLAADDWVTVFKFWFQLLAVYGLGVGFVSKMGGLKSFGDILEDMVSPDFWTFFSGNFRFLGIFFSITSLGFQSERSPGKANSLSCLGQILLVLLFPVIVIYGVFHLLILVPLAYLAFVLATSLVERVTGAAGDVELKVISEGEKSEEEEKISLKGVIAENEVAAKSFLIGLPSVVLALLTQIIQFFR